MSSIFSMDLLNLLFKNSNDAVFFMEKTDEKYRYIFVNDAAVKLINTNPCGKYIEQVIPSHLAKTIIQHYNLTTEHHKQVEFEDYTYEKMNIRKQRTTTIPVVQDGKNYILAITKEVSTSRDLGEVEQFLAFQYNIQTSEKELMSELYKIERIFRAITENTNDFIVVTDRFGKIKYSSPSYSRKLGYEEEELLGVPYDRLLKPESVKVWQEALNPEAVDLKEEQKIELLLHTKDNSPIWTEGNYTLTFDLADHEISEIVMVSREITERKQLEDQLTYLAYHDSLTQLGNRRKLYKDFPLLKTESDERGTCLAIFYLDGDNFKQVNDVYGHDVGDEFLIQFGNSLVRSVRDEDMVVRLGGDEFLIVLTGLSIHEKERCFQITHIMDRFKENLKNGWTIRGVHFSPTASIGISIYPQHSKNLDDLIDLADQALYKAKQSSTQHFLNIHE